MNDFQRIYYDQMKYFFIFNVVGPLYCEFIFCYY